MTIVAMRHGKFAIIEACCHAMCVHSLEQNEEWQYDPHYFMKEEWPHINYGVGNSIKEAFKDFKIKYENLIRV